LSPVCRPLDYHALLAPPRPHHLFFFQSSGDHRDLHSFPTRRSSDLFLEMVPEGEWSFHDFLDSDGGVEARPFRVDLTLSRRCRRSEEHTSEFQSRGHLVCRLLLEKKKKKLLSLGLRSSCELETVGYI